MSHINFPIELRCSRIPATWKKRRGEHQNEKGRFSYSYYVPSAPRYSDTDLIQDPWKLRTEFLRMKHTEDDALEFLGKVGVWDAVDHEPQSNLPETTLEGTFGVRHFVGHARPVTLEELWTAQEHWKDLLSPDGRAKLRNKFAPPKADARDYVRGSFAVENTLPVHLEWKLGREQLPYAIVQPITFLELLTATVWIDLAKRAKFRVCQNVNCRTPFTGRKKKHCSESCAHAVAVRAYRKRMKKSKSGKNRPV